MAVTQFYYKGLTVPQLAALYAEGDSGAMQELLWREFVSAYCPEIYATGDVEPILYNPKQGRPPVHGDPPPPVPMPRPIVSGGGNAGGGGGGSWMPIYNEGEETPVYKLIFD